MPKLFLSSPDTANFEKYNNGIIGITFCGNISTQSVTARSCLPIGPVFSVEEVNGNFISLVILLKMFAHLLFHDRMLDREIIKLRNLDDDTSAPPLVQLENVLSTIPAEQSYLLKRELLVGKTATITAYYIAS